MSTISNLPEAYGADRDPWPGHHTDPHTDTSNDTTVDTGTGGDGVLVRAGTYWLGDVGLALTQAQWDTLLGDPASFSERPVRAVRLDTTGMPLNKIIALGGSETFEVIAYPAALGPGTYFDGHGTRLHTDTGLFGLVPAAALIGLDDVEQDAIVGLGTFLDFPSPTRATDSAGLLRFGGHTIDTTEPDALGPRCACGRLLVSVEQQGSRAERTRAAAQALAAGGVCSRCATTPPRKPCACTGPCRPKVPVAVRHEDARAGQVAAAFWSSLAGH